MAVRSLLLLAASAMVAAPAIADENPVAIVLTANRAAMGVPPGRSAALRLTYRYAGQGLTGTEDELVDIERGRFVATRRLGSFTEQDGFDGTSAWARERSGSVSTQDGGDMRQLAVSRAYRAANRWWRPDHGGAAIAYLGRRTSDAVVADVLRVTPARGAPFDAWFDARTHLLTRVEEQRHGRTTIMRLSGYTRLSGVMTAGRIAEGTGEPSDDEVLTLTGAMTLQSTSPKAYGRPVWHPEDTAFAAQAQRTVIRFRIINGHIYGDVTVNGRGPYPFMFDTGGGMS